MPPIIIGVADIKNQTSTLHSDGRDEPASLMHAAILSALSDTSLSPSATSKLINSIDSLSVVRPWSWPYPDLPSQLSSLLSIAPSHRHTSPHGGNQPAKLVDGACRRIARGESRAAVVCGGEALDSLARYVKAGSVPPPGWTEVADLESFAAAALRPPSEARTLKGVHGVGAPIQVYPLYENALRASERRSWHQANAESARMYAEFADVAATHPASWGYGRSGGEEGTEAFIGTPSERNRLICWPYTMRMCAFNNVNVAGAVVVTSSEWAEELGVPKEKWVYVLGGAGTAESEEFYMRTSFTEAPAIARSIDAALHATAVGRDEVDLFDFYSCFPIVPKLACRHLGLSTSRPQKPITLLGGLTSFGGAGNNYSMHAIAEMARQLRKGEKRKKTGLVLANGGVLSYQHVVLLSSTPGRNAYPAQPPLPEHLDELPATDFDERPEGEAVIETYTVDFGRKGQPKRGHVVGRLVGSGRRFVANHGDERTLGLLCSKTDEPIGRKGLVSRSADKDGQNLFTLLPEGKL